jgi:acyl carrier protein
VTHEEIRAAILEIVGAIAPEADLAHLAAEAPLRDALDLDSMDFLNFVIGIHERFGVEIPESDYRHLTTLAACVEYVSRLQRAPRLR